MSPHWPPNEQRNKAFRFQAFLALRFGFARGKRRKALARAKAEAAQKLRETLDQVKATVAAAGGNPAGWS